MDTGAVLHHAITAEETESSCDIRTQDLSPTASGRRRSASPVLWPANCGATPNNHTICSSAWFSPSAHLP